MVSSPGEEEVGHLLETVGPASRQGLRARHGAVTSGGMAKGAAAGYRCEGLVRAWVACRRRPTLINESAAVVGCLGGGGAGV